MTQHLDPRTLVELPDNPRYIDDDDFERLCESITRNPDLFQARPILCSDRTGELVVIGGNQRLKAALHIGLATVPVFVFSGLTVEREREIAVRDNVTNGEWDATKLEGWSECDLVGWGVGIAFDETDLPEYEREGDNSVAGKAEPLQASEDAYEAPPKEEIKTDIVLGDLITFEKDGIELHRLLCGDSTDAATVARLMAGEKANLMVTDPPYGVNYDPKWRDGLVQNSDTANGDKIQGDDRTDWAAIYPLFNAPVCYVWHAPTKTKHFAQSLEDNGYELKYLIVWNKDNFAIGRGDYHHKHETCWYAVQTGANHNYQGRRDQSTVWDIPMIRNHEDRVGHSNQKPIECMARPISNNSAEGQLIADPFLGSGSTMVAAHQLNRRCYGLELEPRYNQIIAERMHKLDPTLTIKRNGEPMQFNQLPF